MICCKRYHEKLKTLQLAVAEDPLEPCCWLWTNVWPAQLSTLSKAALSALDISSRVSKWNLCNLPLQKIHWSLAAGSGRNFQPAYCAQLTTLFKVALAALYIQ